MRHHVLAVIVAMVALEAASATGLIDIGSRKQLFLDTDVIESMIGVRQVLVPATKATGNPVIRQDRPWEGNSLHYGTVFYDDKQKRFRMWYTSSTVFTDADGEIQDRDNRICYATSRDGYAWEKPSLGFVEFQGSKQNNILAAENWPQIKGGIFVDPREPDPAKRYKALAQVSRSQAVPGRSDSRPTSVWSLYYSADAFHWTPHPDNPVIQPSGVAKVHPEGEPWAKSSGFQSYLWGPTASVGWDPIRNVYAMHMENCQHKRCPLQMRVIGRAESRDLVHWTEPQTIIVPDDRDPEDLQFYSMWATTYGEYYIGMLWNYRPGKRTPEAPLYIWPQFVFSRDGIRYDRRFREPFIPPATEPAWDSVTIYPQQPIAHGENVFIYYHGTNYRDRKLDRIGKPGPIGAMGLAVVPVDRFVALEGGGSREGTGLNGKALEAVRRTTPEAVSFGQVVTRPFTFSGRKLEVNVAGVPGAAASELRVEILGGDHFRVAGYTFGDADSLSGEGTSRTVSWKGRSDVSGLAGKAVRLRFYLKNARLFSFRFVDP